ncbi:restriction endonuclease S subunit [Frankia torreyi]|uniref:Restriction endonuclease S subunit n=1 Tax=Frankia torreyi TaxID=1856 RepID=A0A0D8BKT2_9ACTN|nr:MULTISPECIES: restriction endonuclease subunit S [Frankia]KJE24853.1 restriction endonuclease S subunit [Frankia torreyi]
MTNLPLGWEWACLEDLLAVESRAITDGPFGSNLASRHYTASGVRVIRLQNIGDGIFNDEDRAYIADDHFESLRAHEVCAGDLIVASLGDNLPRVCIMPKFDVSAIVKADCIRVRPHHSIDPHWLLYFLSAPQSRSYAASRIRGVGRPRLGLGELRRMPLPVPPLAEQRRIVTVLDEYLPRLAKAADSLGRVNIRSRDLALSIISSAVEGRLVKHSTSCISSSEEIAAKLARQREVSWAAARRSNYNSPVAPNIEPPPSIPRGWALVSLEAATDPIRTIRYGILKPNSPGVREVPYVEVRDLSAGSLVRESLKRTSKEMDTQFPGSRLRAGDVVMAIRGSYERSAVISSDLTGVNISRDVARISPLPDLASDYLHLYLQGRFSRQYFARHARGVAVKGVNISAIRALPVVIPPIVVQREIVREVERCLSVVEIWKNSTAIVDARSRRLRGALLAEAFAGRLVTQDPGDEPASMLLAQIQGERAGMAKVPPRRRTPKSAGAGPATVRPARGWDSVAAASVPMLPLGDMGIDQDKDVLG